MDAVRTTSRSPRCRTRSPNAPRIGCDTAATGCDATALAIPQGSRNITLFKLGCVLRRYGLNVAALTACLQAINREHAIPPDADVAVATIAAGIARRYPTRSA